MSSELEFVRGNQKNYIRTVCEEYVFNEYEYQMCINNRIRNLLPFQQRSENGENYLYYEVTGMQSLDIYLQTRKLKREFMEVLAKGIIKLYEELYEYALDMTRVNFKTKYILIGRNGEDVRFLYSFSKENIGNAGIEELLESCIECLDYKDELLMKLLYQVYENFLDQGEDFWLDKEMEELLKGFHIVDEINCTQIQNPFEEKEEEIPLVKEKDESNIIKKEKKRLIGGLISIFIINIVAFFIWKPITILKVFFLVSMGSVLLALIIHSYKQIEKNEKEKKKQQEDNNYIKEYEEINYKIGLKEDCTQIINIKDVEQSLYSVYGKEPKNICFLKEKRIIGKDASRVQICIPNDGVSRLHAMIVHDESGYKVEDLNSTNGTWVNGKRLTPREPYALHDGDKVSFAEAEYIFR